MSELILTRPLLAWLRQGPRWADLGWTKRARMNWLARLGSVNAGLTAQLLQDAPPLRDPVFVLGPWRSGSTVMHELLVAASGLPTPQTWQCMNAPAFLLGRAPQTAQAEARPMDGLPVSAQSPQEDEFGLLSLGSASLYRAFWQPERSAELMPLLRSAYWLQDCEWLPPWETFLQAVLQSQGRAGEALLLKSPNHSLRWAAMRQRFPAARAVWMLRDAEAVYRSNLKMWGQMAALHGLGAAPEDALNALIVAALHALAEALREAMRAATPHLVWQQQLRETPRETVSETCAALQLPCALDTPAFAAALQATAQGRSERYPEQDLGTAARDAIAALDAAQAEAWSAFSDRR